MAGTTATGLTGAADTNHELDPTTGTMLCDIDTSLNHGAIQSPPNVGSRLATGQLTVDPNTPVGFDLDTDLKNGVAQHNRGLASLVVGGVSGFYRVNVWSRRAIRIGNFDDTVLDIAIPLDQSGVERGSARACGEHADRYRKACRSPVKFRSSGLGRHGAQAPWSMPLSRGWTW